MPLDPAMKTLLEQMEAIGAPPIHTLSVAEARTSMDAMVRMMGEGEPVGSIVDRTIDAGGQTLPVRIYRPEALSPGTAPTLVFYHGGGFVVGGLLSHDRDCRALANRGECQVIAVDYRLAPEHPFPAAAEDAVAALEYIVANAGELDVDVDHLAVGGDSAGGNLAAVAALHARDVGIALKLQLLIYPAVAGIEGDYPSRLENATGYMLDTESIAWFTEAYFPGGFPDDWRAAPMQATSHEAVAPALIITAEFDPLRDEGEAYATKLEAIGVPAKASRYDGLIHGFFGMGPIVPAANAAVEEAGAALRDALHD
jgi:acetyl esterase/lipase